MYFFLLDNKMTINIPTISAENFNINELTDGSLDGKGAYDVLLKTFKAHLAYEYEKQRIRGTDYVNAYVQLLSQGLSNIAGYALDKAKLPLELQLLEAQMLKVGADTILTTKQGGLADAQITKEMAEAEKLHLEMQYKLPKELEMIDAQIKDMKITTDLKEYELKHIKPLELALREKELLLKQYQINVMERELEIKAEQLALARYELKFKAPAEVDSINAQTGLYQQKTITEKAQTDGSVIREGSVMAMNNAVLAEQAQSYKNDGKIKVLSILADTWKVRRNDDPDEAPVTEINKLNDPTIGVAVSKSMQSVGLIT